MMPHKITNMRGKSRRQLLTKTTIGKSQQQLLAKNIARWGEAGRGEVGSGGGNGNEDGVKTGKKIIWVTNEIPPAFPTAQNGPNQLAFVDG
jgi:hypothetical protein